MGAVSRGTLTAQGFTTIASAVGLGLLVQSAGILPFSWLLAANLRYGVNVPWACAAELLLLWGFCRYLNGWGQPRSTALRRQALFRFKRVDAHLLLPAVLASCLLAVSIGLLVVLMYMLVRYPESAGANFLALASAPPLTAVTLIPTLAVTTGIVEEAAFRGYMQTPIEECCGPQVAIPVVAVVFAVVHFPPLVVFPLFVFGAIGWGLLAWLLNSTIPGMIAHALVDAVFLLWVWYDPDAFTALLAYSALETGPDAAFWKLAAATAASIGATGFAFVWIAKKRASPAP